MPILFKLSAIAIVLVTANTAHAASVYEQQQQICKAIMQKVDENLSGITGRDLIKDNNRILKATLWGTSYQQNNCDPEPYLNTLRRTLNK
tara:strand:- start:131296 stop:131565 length:270 start_codon:yes stop_codon:yes gene_type:complete